MEDADTQDSLLEQLEKQTDEEKDVLAELLSNKEQSGVITNQKLYDILEKAETPRNVHVDKACLYLSYSLDRKRDSKEVVAADTLVIHNYSSQNVGYEILWPVFRFQVLQPFGCIEPGQSEIVHIQICQRHIITSEEDPTPKPSVTEMVVKFQGMRADTVTVKIGPTEESLNRSFLSQEENRSTTTTLVSEKDSINNIHSQIDVGSLNSNTDWKILVNLAEGFLSQETLGNTPVDSSLESLRVEKESPVLPESNINLIADKTALEPRQKNKLSGDGGGLLIAKQNKLTAFILR